MIVTAQTRRALRWRREKRDMERLGFRMHECDWEIHRGHRTRERIVAVRISCCGKYVYTKLGAPNE